MFDSLKKYKGTLAALVLLVLGYYAFTVFGPEEVTEAVFSNDSAYADGSRVGAEIVSILGEISAIRLDTSLFEDESFNRLVDMTAVVTAESQGRRNPFDPIGFGVNLEGNTAEPIDIEEKIFNIYTP